jgi:hypothetical protein
MSDSKELNPTVILSCEDSEGSPNCRLRILRSFAVFAAQDDVLVNVAMNA